MKGKVMGEGAPAKLRAKTSLVVFLGATLMVSGFFFVESWMADIAARPKIECSLHFDSTIIDGVPQVTTQAQMQRGLSGRHDVGSGMLFSWPDDDHRLFWMKGTPSPLSIAFIDAQGEVVQIEDMEPNSEYLHRSRQPVREAFEVRRGDFQRLNIGVGSRLVGRECAAMFGQG